MLENLMEDNKLDLDATLLSVRRYSAGSVAGSAPHPVAKSGEEDRNPVRPPATSRRSSLPFYKSDVKTGPVRHPGTIPFVWEQTPGQPKSSAVSTSSAAADGGVGMPLVASRPPPGRSFFDKDAVAAQAPAAAPSMKPGTSVRTRKAVTFAPAVNKISWKSSEVSESSSAQKVSLEKEKKKDQQPMPKVELNHFNGEGEDEEEEDHEAFSNAVDTLSRAESIFLNCSVSGISGFTDSAKPSPSFSTNPQVRDFMMGRFLSAAQAMASSSPQYTFRKPAAPARAHETTRPSGRVAGGDYRKPPPVPLQQKLYKVSQYIVQQQDSWEAVYRHKLGQWYQPEVEDGRSKLTSESNQLTFSSDSPTADSSSPYRHSTGGLSPFRNEAPFHEGKGFLGVPSRENKTDSSDGRLSSGSGSPSLEKTLYIDSASMQEAADSKSSSFNAFTFTKGVSSPDEKDFEVGYGSQKIEENLLVEKLRPKVSEIAALGLPFGAERLCRREAYVNDNLKQNLSDNDILHYKDGHLIKIKDSALRPLLPLPPPKTPSESWLSRTLPSGASKKPIPQSLLGICSQPRKHATINMPSVDLKLQANAKHSKPQRHQLKFAEVLAKPASPKSEI